MPLITRALFVAALLLFLSGCLHQEETLRSRIETPEPLRPPSEVPQQPALLAGTDGSDGRADEPLEAYAAPVPPVPTQAPKAEFAPQLPVFPEQAPVSVNVESLPIPAFIKEVYGNLLGLSFELDPEIRKRNDLVTFRTASAIAPEAIFEMARRILRDYGVVVELDQDLIRFSYSRQAVDGEPPLFISGRALPSVPVSHRPIFQLVPLYIVAANDVAQWLRLAFKGLDIDIQPDHRRNSLFLKAPAPIMAEALEAVKLLDRPFMRGRQSLIIKPRFLVPTDLSKMLNDILVAEGVAASTNPEQGSVYFQPIDEAELLLVFAADPQILKHIQDWAARLDVLGRGADDQHGIFLYAVQHTSADDLAAVVSKLMPEVEAILKADQGLPPLKDTATPATRQTSNPGAPGSTTPLSGSTVVVDDARNTLIFAGRQDAWERLLPILQRLDSPAKQVLVEVTVAEVTLNEDETLGVEWMLENAGVDDFKGALSSAGLGLGGAGLAWFPTSNSGATKLMLNAFASDQRITLLQTPRLMVRSGESATIDVGTEVPVVTTQGTDPDVTGILQEIQYRKTGVILKITPRVYAGRNIDLEISQEVSEAQPNTISSVESPLILNRSVSTSLSLTDGGSVLLGGMISSTRQQGRSGVPGLKEIPYLGRLFRVDDRQNSRTELLILIVPYVLDGHREAQEITNAFRERLSF